MRTNVTVFTVALITIIALYFVGVENQYITAGIILSALIIIALAIYLKKQIKEARVTETLPKTKYTYNPYK